MRNENIILLFPPLMHLLEPHTWQGEYAFPAILNQIGLPHSYHPRDFFQPVGKIDGKALERGVVVGIRGRSGWRSESNDFTFTRARDVSCPGSEEAELGDNRRLESRLRSRERLDTRPFQGLRSTSCTATGVTSRSLSDRARSLARN